MDKFEWLIVVRLEESSDCMKIESVKKKKKLLFGI